jgi:hypothetical protein
MMTRTVLSLTLALAFLVAMPATVLAATAVKLDMPHLVERSEVIVVAQVTDLESKLEEDGRVYTTIHLQTEEVLKGQMRKEFSLRQVGGRDGDVATRAPGMPGFEEGETVFLFLRNVDTFPVVTGLSQGKFHVALGPDESTRYVVPQVDGVRLLDPKEVHERRGEDAQPLSTDLMDHRATFQQVHEFDAFRDRVEELIEGDGPTGDEGDVQ